MAALTGEDWQAEAARLRREEKMATAEIAERVGRSASQVRRVLAKANAERFTGEPDVPFQATSAEIHSTNGHAPIPGQTTVDDFTVPAEDDPEHPDTLADFRAETGEPVGPMLPPALPEPEAYEVRLKGTRQMALDFGENANLPTGATVVLKSEKLTSGFFGLGDEFSGTFRARITKAPGEEGFDKDFEEWRTKDTAYSATILEVTFD